MTIYIIFFIANILFGLLLSFKRGRLYFNELSQNKVKRGIYLTVTTLQYGLLCGLRSNVMGYDTDAYNLIFNMTPNTWSTIFDRTTYVEMGFSVLCSVVKIFGGDYQLFLIICSLFSMGACCIFINRHSNNVIMSVIIILSFPFFYSQFDIIRHFMAIGWFLLGYKYIEDGKFIKFLIFILIGSSFHKIVLLFIPFYFVKNIKFDAIFVIIVFALTIVSYLYLTEIAFFLGDLIGKGTSSLVDHGFLGTDAGGYKTVLMYIAILVFGVAAYYLLEDKTGKDKIYIFYIALVVIASIVSTNARIAIRFIMSFVPLMSIAVPHLLDVRRTKSKNFMILLVTCFIGVAFLYHGFMLVTDWSNVIPYVPFTK